MLNKLLECCRSIQTRMWLNMNKDLRHEKERVRANYEQAAQCYLAMAEGIGGTGKTV